MIVVTEAIGNRGGIPFVNATQESAGSATSNAAFSLPNHTFRNVGGIGLIIINFNAAVTTSTGINVIVNDSSLALLNSEADALTTITAGLHILLFDKKVNKLQLIV